MKIAIQGGAIDFERFNGALLDNHMLLLLNKRTRSEFKITFNFAVSATSLFQRSMSIIVIVWS